MQYKFEQQKDSIIADILEKLKGKLKTKQGELCGEFVQQFLRTVAEEDLLDRNSDDLYGAMINLWNFIHQREPQETKIRIYNPDFERHGWQSTHTIVEIVHDDMPFLVDSILMEINRLGLTSHLVMHMGGIKLLRGEQGEITKIYPRVTKAKNNVSTEAPILVEINRQTDEAVLHDLKENLHRVLGDVRAAVYDWEVMRSSVGDAIGELNKVETFLDPEELKESVDFLRWIEDHHFTFLGVRDYELVVENNQHLLKAIEDSGYGVLSSSSNSKVSRVLEEMTPEARNLTLSSQILIISKTNTLSSVHRPIYTDYIGIKRFDENGKVIGERRIIGLYTSAAYNTNPKQIPFLRHKVTSVMENAHVHAKSHAGKVLLNILETLPRDDLFQASTDELLEMAMGIYHMQERRRIRMFARRDVYGRFISALVYVPKERFNTELRESMQIILQEAFNATEVNFSTRFSDSVLARIHFVIRTDTQELECNLKDVEKKLIEIGRTWRDDLKDNLLDTYGEEKGAALYNRYQNAFTSGYRETFSSRTAVYDLKHIELLGASSPLEMNFYRPMDELSGIIRFKVYKHLETVPLSDVLPILENMGMRVISERPYQVRLGEENRAWINDFGMIYTQNPELEIDQVKELFQDAFIKTWLGEVESDGFNQLILGARLNWREVAMLRAISKYLKQIQFTFSQDYIENALKNNPEITRMLVQLFHSRFKPQHNPSRSQDSQALVEQLLKSLDHVANLDEDRILRRYIDVINAVLRTNYYQKTANGGPKSYISFKLASRQIPDIPLPLPMFEIFVYSPRFEGVHLRMGNVARGGLRWSDRMEDFRTEILGLMKAQQVKNAVIVPCGAKGGFVAKAMPVNGSREEIMAEGIACYKRFIRGLLDVTDNYQGGEIIKPNEVVAFDDDDPYLVVAADKGTATFSDIANSISEEYDFWLGDAFASGGSTGYDHKKMGITARGAWESVKRHFRELGRDIQKSEVSVVGIGDMAGDVFGNGMLLSPWIKLVGAFNHLHIFIDPNPCPKTSFAERQRLFNLPRSAWTDYDQSLLSEGGGIFDRKAKSIKLSKEIKALLQLQQDYIVPNDLIRAMLKAPVDLLWNGGIGTYVKAENESHMDVGDRTNDSLRINASELRCKVVGEGGNLGFTQEARKEYAIYGGLIYTDFIDNSAGVDCSDNEVNIKILLNDIVANGDMTVKQRNQLLAEMTDEVAELVLMDNYQQTQAISLAATQALRNVELHSRYMQELETSGKLDRNLEFLPDEKTLMERKLKGKGLLRPGIAVMLAYSKSILNEQILESDVPEDAYLSRTLFRAFPKPLREKYKQEMQRHRLKREIIATKLSNTIVNEMGFTFIYRLQDETGAPISAIVRAYTVARGIFGLETMWRRIQALDNQISSQSQIDMMLQIIRLIRRSTRWFLRNQRMHLDIATAVDFYAPGVARLNKILPEILGESERNQFDSYIGNYIKQGVPEDLAIDMAKTRPLFSALDIIDAANELETSIEDVATMYFSVGSYLELSWIRSQIIAHPTENHWEALSREALRDDLDWQQRQLSASILSIDTAGQESCLGKWSELYQELIERWRYILADLRASASLNFTMYFVAIRELLDLTQTTAQVAKIDSEIVFKKPAKLKV